MIYFKYENYINPYSWKSSNYLFKSLKIRYKLKKISESDVFLEML